VHAEVVPLDSVAVQLKLKTAPSTTEAVAGAIEIEVTVAAGAVTVRTAEAGDAPAADTVIVADPGRTPVTVLLDTEAMLGFEEV
jgi:hypothetical protein